MEYVIAGALIVAAMVITGVLMVQAFIQDYLVNPWMGAFLIWAVFIVAVLIAAADQDEKKGPCLRYETSMYWNSGTKTMMPARICVERAEWVKP